MTTPQAGQGGWRTLFSLNAEAGPSLQVQIRTQLMAAIRSGILPPGARLASSRDLAEALGVSRNTVVLAFKHLIASQILEVRDRSGVQVAPGAAAKLAPGAAPDGQEAGAVDWTQKLALIPSRQRNIEKPWDWRRYRYPFIYGQSDPTLFPMADWRDCARTALSANEIEGWSGDLIDGDYAPLIEQLRLGVLPRRGVWARPDEIILTLGAQNALYMIASLLGGPGRTVAVENPGYPDARNIFALSGAQIVQMRPDAEGIDPAHAPRGPALLYLSPCQQCPTGAVMSEARRTRLLEEAERQDWIIIEDDYGSELLGETNAPAALKAEDRAGRVIYVGSLSKILAPGLRLGYIVAPAPLIKEFRALRRLMLRHPPSNNQHMTSLFLSLGYGEAHFVRYAATLQARALELKRALHKHLPGWKIGPGANASSLWVETERDLEVRKLAALAAQDGVLIEPGDIFFERAEDGARCIRFGLASISLDRIETGIQILAGCAGRLLHQTRTL